MALGFSRIGLGVRAPGTVLRDDEAIAALTRWIAAAPDFTLDSRARIQDASSPRKGPSPPEP